jgi:hypothetical protein
VIEGDYGTTVGETGPEEPGLSTVLSKHAEGDVDPVRELPYRLAALINRCITSRTDGSIRQPCQIPPKSTCVEGGVHRWKADVSERPLASSFFDERMSLGQFRLAEGCHVQQRVR